MKLVVYVHWSHIKPKEILNIEKPHVYSYIIKHTHGKTMRQTDYLHYLTKKSPRLPLGRQCDASLQATSVMAKSIHCTSVWERERQRRREGRGRRMTVSSFFKNRGGRSELLSRVTPYTHTHTRKHTHRTHSHTHLSEEMLMCSKSPSKIEHLAQRPPCHRGSDRSALQS